MVEVIPSINVDNFEEVARRIKLVEPYVDWVHLDVSDGTFSKHVSWHNPKDLVGFESKVKIEVHLMIEKPEKKIIDWLLTPASRIIFHQESTKNHDLIIEQIHKAEKEAGIAIKPNTPWLKLFPYFGKVEVLQLLAVFPGLSGQILNNEVVYKITHVQGICHPCKIEIDGGVNLKNAKKLIKEGADILVAGNAIFNSDNIENMIKELKKL